MRILSTLLKPPAIWLCGAVTLLLMGVVVRSQMLDGALHDTYFAGKYSYYMIAPAAWFVFFAALYWGILRISNQRFPKWAGQLHFWLMFIGVNLSFFGPLFVAVRRGSTNDTDYEELFRTVNTSAEAGAWLTIASLAFFICFTAYYFITNSRAKP